MPKFFNSRLFLFGVIVVAVMVVFAYARTYYQDYLVRQEISKLKENAKSLEVKKLELLEALDYVKSTTFVEEKARVELNMAKAGEHVAVIKNETAKVYGQGPKAVVESDNKSNFYKWWLFFMGSKPVPKTAD